MKKIILSIAMLASITFVSCSDDDDNSCKTCENSAHKVEVCDNGDGTAILTVSAQGETETITVDIPEGESIDTIGCDYFESF